jgi:transposase
MGDRFKTIDRDTEYLFPPSVQEWLQDHLARFVVEIVEGLNLERLNSSYRGSGSEASPPLMMVALLFYGYSTGVFSSRKLEQATYDSEVAMLLYFLMGISLASAKKISTDPKNHELKLQ